MRYSSTAAVPLHMARSRSVPPSTISTWMVMPRLGFSQGWGGSRRNFEWCDCGRHADYGAGRVLHGLGLRDQTGWAWYWNKGLDEASHWCPPAPGSRHKALAHPHTSALPPSTPAGDQSDTPTNDKSAARALFSGLDFIGISAYSPLKVKRPSGGGLRGGGGQNTGSRVITGMRGAKRGISSAWIACNLCQSIKTP